MPGLLEHVCHTSYGYVDPYVEKARNKVTLIDKAAQRLEMYIPPVIETADKYMEPAVKYVQPYVEPKVDMLKEKVGPYYDLSVEKYTRGVEKVEEIKASTKAVVTPHVDKICTAYDRSVEKVGEIRSRGVDKVGEIKASTKAIVSQAPGVDKICTAYDRSVEKVGEIRSRGVDKVEEIKASTKAVVSPRVKKIRTAFTQRSEEIQQIRRNTASQNLQDLKAAKSTLLGRAYATSVRIVEKTEVVIDRWLPAPPSDTQSTGSEDSASSDCPLLPRVTSLPCTIMTRLTCMLMLKVQLLNPTTQQLKKHYQAGTLVPESRKKLKEGHAMVAEKYNQLIASSCTMLKVKSKLLSLQKAPLYQKSIAAAGKAGSMALAGCEKAFGAERTKAALAKLEERVPASWKAANETTTTTVVQAVEITQVQIAPNEVVTDTVVVTEVVGPSGQVEEVIVDEQVEVQYVAEAAPTTHHRRPHRQHNK